MVAEKTFRRLNAPQLLKELYQGATYATGNRVSEPVQRRLIFLHTY